MVRNLISCLLVKLCLEFPSNFFIESNQGRNFEPTASGDRGKKMFFDFRLLLLPSPAKEKLLMNFFRCKLLPRDSWQNFHLEKQRSNIGALGVLTKERMFVELDRFLPMADSEQHRSQVPTASMTRCLKTIGTDGSGSNLCSGPLNKATNLAKGYNGALHTP